MGVNRHFQVDLSANGTIKITSVSDWCDSENKTIQIYIRDIPRLIGELNLVAQKAGEALLASDDNQSTDWVD